MARPKKYGEARDQRITISVTKTEGGRISADAQKAKRSISDYLVSCAIERATVSTVPTGFDLKGLSVEGAIGALGSGGFALDYLDGLHPTMRASVGDYRGALERGGEEFKEAVERGEFIPKQFAYPSNGSTGQLQADILDEILRLDDFGKRAAFFSPKNAEAHFARPGLIARKRILYLYPFFLHPSRRPYWGVIPYATHKRIGILLKNDVFPRLIKEPIFPGEKAWLGQVIDKLCETETYKIGFAEGFFEEEIAEVIWSNSQSTHEFDFELKRKPLSAGDLYRFDKNDAHFTKTLEDSNIALLVFDLCYQNEIASCIGDKWTVVEYPHGAPVPVGIGFTLSFLPRLLAHDNWRALRLDALAKLAVLSPLFKSYGIELESEHWNNPTLE